MRDTIARFKDIEEFKGLYHRELIFFDLVLTKNNSGLIQVWNIKKNQITKLLEKEQKLEIHTKRNSGLVLKSQEELFVIRKRACGQYQVKKYKIDKNPLFLSSNLRYFFKLLDSKFGAVHIIDTIRDRESTFMSNYPESIKFDFPLRVKSKRRAALAC